MGDRGGGESKESERHAGKPGGGSAADTKPKRGRYGVANVGSPGGARPHKAAARDRDSDDEEKPTRSDAVRGGADARIEQMRRKREDRAREKSEQDQRSKAAAESRRRERLDPCTQAQHAIVDGLEYMHELQVDRDVPVDGAQKQADRAAEPV